MSAPRRDKGKAIASDDTPPPQPTKRPRTNPSGGGEGRSKHRHDALNRRFRDKKASEDYENLFKDRSIVRDRAVVLEGDDVPFLDVVDAYITRGWTHFNKIMGTGYQDLTREFYANFRKNTDPYTNQEIPYTSYLKGKTINISEDILRSLLRIPEAPDSECQYTHLLTGFSLPENEDRVQKVLDICCEDRAKFMLVVDKTPRCIKKNLLTSVATIWCHIVLSSLLPVKHATEMVVKRMVLIYCLMEDLYVDLPRMILTEMNIAAMRRVHLPYCSVITQLAKRHKIDVQLEGGRKVLPELIIDRSWVEDRVYKGPVARRRVWEQIRGHQPAPQAPPPRTPPPPTMKNIMSELQAMKRMQLGTYDMVANLTRQLATSLNFDAATVMGDQADRDQWMASIGFTMPPTGQHDQADPAEPDIGDEEEAGDEEDEGEEDSDEGARMDDD